MPLAVVDASLASGNSPEDPVDASLIELIGAPERFRGRWVRVIGYLPCNSDGTRLTGVYLTIRWYGVSS